MELPPSCNLCHFLLLQMFLLTFLLQPSSLGRWKMAAVVNIVLRQRRYHQQFFVFPQFWKCCWHKCSWAVVLDERELEGRPTLLILACSVSRLTTCCNGWFGFLICQEFFKRKGIHLGQWAKFSNLPCQVNQIMDVGKNKIAINYKEILHKNLKKVISIITVVFMQTVWT